MSFNPVSGYNSYDARQRGWSPVDYVVQDREDLHDIAQRFGVTVEALLSANPSVASATSVRAGQHITIPARSDPTNVATGQPQPTIGPPFVAQPLVTQSPFVFARAPTTSGPPSVVPVYHKDSDVDRIWNDVTAAGDDRAQLTRLNDHYQRASDDLRRKLLQDPRAAALFKGAARYANEPLQKVPSDPDNPDIQPHTSEAMTRLDALTQGLDADLAAGVVREAWPAYEAIEHRFVGYPVLGFNGTQVAIRIADRVWRASDGADLIRRMVTIGGGNLNSLGAPLYEGAGPAYLIELGRQGAVLPGDVSLLEFSLSGAEQFRSGRIDDHVKDYLGHLDELRFLVQNGGAAMSPQQLDNAIRDYVKTKGPEWEARLNELKSQLASDGASLLNQVQQLEAGLTSLPPGQRDAMRTRIAALLKSPEAQLAVGMALNQNPALVQGRAGTQLVQTFANLGIVGKDNTLAVTLVSAYLRENVLGPAANLDLSNPASLAQMRTQLTQALQNNAGLATVLQIKPEQLNEVADALLGLVPDSTRPVDAFEFGNTVSRNANNAFDKLDAVLGRDTPFNLAFRASAVAIVGTGLVDAIDRYGDDPRLRNGIDVLLEAARVGVDSTQLFATIRQWPEGTGVAALKTAGKFVHILGATMAGADGLNRLAQGDYAGAGLSFVVAGGVTWGALGSSAAAGPIGFGTAAVATLGLWIYDSVRSASHNSRFETDTTAQFLENAGFDAEAARALIDQSGEGYSPVPLLMRYGELRGLKPAEVIAWINSIDPDRLAALRNNLHRTLDEIDGEVARFGATDASDRMQIIDTQQRPWFAASGVSRPMSAAQLDAILAVLEIRRP